MARTYYANALLSDGKILFWYTGDKCDVTSFYKDFGHAHINMIEYFKNHKIECKSMGFIDDTEEDEYNWFIFEDLAKAFYKRWGISPDSRGGPAY